MKIRSKISLSAGQNLKKKQCTDYQAGLVLTRKIFSGNPGPRFLQTTPPQKKQIPQNQAPSSIIISHYLAVRSLVVKALRYKPAGRGFDSR